MMSLNRFQMQLDKNSFLKESRAYGVFMEVTALRSALQHACSELGNLTNVELTEGKWPTKKKIFEQLFAKSPSLVDQHEELFNLIDDRNSESSKQKRDGVSRDERIETESRFRTKFMRIVLNGLHRVRWPPTQEAFSDPLDALFSDVSSFIDAVKFLLQVAVPSGNRSLFSSNQQRVLTPPKTPNASVVKTEKTISPGINVFDTSISMISNTSIYAEDAAVPVRTPASLSARENERLSSTNLEVPENLGLNVKDRKAELNWKAFEVLQRQNEVLSSRLKALQLSVLKRDETEAKIAGVLSELRNSISEIVEVGNAGCSSSKGKATSAVDKGGTSVLRFPVDTGKGISVAVSAALSKEEEMAMFRQEVEREKQEELSKKDKSLGISTVEASKVGTYARGKPPTNSLRGEASPTLCVNCSGRLTSKANTPSFTTAEQPGGVVVWTKLLARIRALEEQWTGTQRAVRRLADGGVGTHGLGSSPQSNPRKSPRSNSSSGGVLYSADMTPSRSLNNCVLGVQSTLLGAVSDDCAFQGVDILASPPQPPCSRSSIGGDGAGAHNFGMDLARIHLLQRDLVTFAEQVFGWTSNCVFPEASSDGSDSPLSAPIRGNKKDASLQSFPGTQQPDVFPSSLTAARRQQQALDMHLAACDLILHLSCVSPVAPLALHSPFRSCLTGLDALIQEMTELAFPKLSKSSQMRLQAAADRALAEQVAVIRCWRQARSCLTQWTRHASTVTPSLRTLGQRFKVSVDHTTRELQDKTNTLRQLLLALDTAETARVRPSSSSLSVDDFSVSSAASNRPAPPISPLDSLVRGSAGKEVSSLVSALRLHRDDLEGMVESVRGLGNQLSGELRRELELLSTTETNVAGATEATLSMLHSSLPGQHVDTGGSMQRKGVRVVADGTAGSMKRAQQNGCGTGSSSVKVSSHSLTERPPFDLSLS